MRKTQFEVASDFYSRIVNKKFTFTQQNKPESPVNGIAVETQTILFVLRVFCNGIVYNKHQTRRKKKAMRPGWATRIIKFLFES